MIIYICICKRDQSRANEEREITKRLRFDSRAILFSTVESSNNWKRNNNKYSHAQNEIT